MNKTEPKLQGIPLACPHCLGELKRSELIYTCLACARVYAVNDGVVRFIDKKDDFYEAAYDATNNIVFKKGFSFGAFLYFHVYKEPYLSAIRKNLKPGAIVLDIGCGGGTRYLAQEGVVAGLDLSWGSLKKAADFYSVTVQADALKPPFADGTFDLITSSYTFEHFRPDEKEVLLRQMHRLLKPGGKIVLIFDCDNNNPLFRWFKKDEALYKECFIEHDHHYGLQMASMNLRMIQDAQFCALKTRAINKTVLQYLPVFGWMAPYGKRLKGPAWVSGLAAEVARRKFLWMPYNMMINWLDLLVEKFLPLDHARVLVVTAQKMDGRG
jgi:SAM-dependent methyltransferase